MVLANSLAVPSARLSCLNMSSWSVPFIPFICALNDCKIPSATGLNEAAWSLLFSLFCVICVLMKALLASSLADLPEP